MNLIKSAAVGKIKHIERLKERLGINARASNGWTALMYAVKHAGPMKVSLLIRHGADVNVKSKEGLTAFMIAAYEDKPGIMKMLETAGADVNAKDVQGFTARMYALGDAKRYWGCCDA